jgi:hypothetical protein
MHNTALAFAGFHHGHLIKTSITNIVVDMTTHVVLIRQLDNTVT